MAFVVLVCQERRPAIFTYKIFPLYFCHNFAARIFLRSRVALQEMLIETIHLGENQSAYGTDVDSRWNQVGWSVSQQMIMGNQWSQRQFLTQRAQVTLENDRLEKDRNSKRSQWQ